MSSKRCTLTVALILACASVANASAASSHLPRYRVIAQPSLSPGGASEGNSINQIGLMAGTSTTASGTTHATAWLFNTAYDLKTLGGASSAVLWPVKNDLGLIVGVSRTADDETLGAVELRARLRSLITPFEPERHATQVAAIRQELGRKSQDLARLLTLARVAPLAIPAVHKLATAFATLDSLAASPNALPATAPQPFGPSWQGLIDQPDRSGSPRLLSRGDPDGLEAGAAKSLYFGPSQPVVPSTRGQADPSETVAARPGAVHS